MTTSSIGRRLTGLAATVALLGIIIGMPILLLAIGANPIPDHMPSLHELQVLLMSPDDGTLLMGLFQVVVWGAWAYMVFAILVEIAAALRGVKAPKVVGLAKGQSAARRLIATAALLFVAVPMTTQTAQAATATAPAVATTQSATSHAAAPAQTLVAAVETAPVTTVDYTVKAGDSLTAIAQEHLGDWHRYKEIYDLNQHLIGDDPGFLEPGWVLKLPAAANTAEHAYTVQAGDTLSEIAQRELGDADRYMEIYDASTATVQPGGGHLTDPDTIDVGWNLTIPGDAPATTPAQERPHAAENQPSVTPPAVDHNEMPAEPVAPTPAESTPTTSAPVETTPAPAPSAVDTSADEDSEDSVLDAPWLLAGLAGGGVLLSGALFIGLQQRRRAQFRARRPGRVIAAPEPELAPVERTISATGAAAAATVEFTDVALRRLAGTCGTLGMAMPPVAAAELDAGRLTLHLSAAADLPAPWVDVAGDRLHWSCGTELELEDLGAETSNVEAPYPLLVTVGETDDGAKWLLNCEELSPLTIAGDPTYGRDLARHLAAQLAMNPWSRGVQIDCIGVAEEAMGLDDRIRYHAQGQDAAATTQEALAAAVATIDRAAGHSTDVSTARTGAVDDDTWPARMLLVDAASDAGELDTLMDLVARNVGRSATSIVVTGEREGTPGTVLHMTSTGRVRLKHAGLDLIAVGLTGDEARGCALLLNSAADLEDAPAPLDETAEDGWESYVDLTGSIRPEYTLPREEPVDEDDGPTSSLLPGDDDAYVNASTVLPEDLPALAPTISRKVREAVEDADPDLDADIAAWFDPTSPRPKLSMLGPITVIAHGKALAKRKAYFSEIVAFLALHRRNGVTRDFLVDAIAMPADRARKDINIVRDWLGADPATGEPYLPHADKSPAALQTGVNVYQFTPGGLLDDVDLFRRLRQRGQIRGDDGLADLVTALELVTGRPFDQQRLEGYNWLDQGSGERHDEYMVTAIADVALTVATAYLATGDIDRARAAAEIGVLAAPYEEQIRLCLARVYDAEGDRREAQRIVRDEICNRSDDGEAPTDLSERTATMIRTHDLAS